MYMYYDCVKNVGSDSSLRSDLHIYVSRARIFKLLRSPRINSNEPIPSGCVAWRPVRQPDSYSVPSPHRLFKYSSTELDTKPERLFRIQLRKKVLVPNPQQSVQSNAKDVDYELFRNLWSKFQLMQGQTNKAILQNDVTCFIYYGRKTRLHKTQQKVCGCT